MSPPDVDPERLAALLDGRLPPDERRRLFDELAASPELREVYADALAAVEAAAPAASSGALPARPRLATRQWIGLAAAAVLVVAIGTSILRRGGETLPPAGSVLVATGTLDTALLGAPWGTLRGADGALSGPARGVRIGAAITSWLLLRREADPSASTVAVGIASLLESIAGGGVVANQWRALAASFPPPGDSAIGVAVRLTEQVAGEDAVRLGSWLQGARAAAAMQDPAPFSAPNVRAARRAADHLAAGDAVREAARRVEQAASSQPRDWAALQLALTDLLRELGAR